MNVKNFNFNFKFYLNKLRLVLLLVFRFLLFLLFRRLPSGFGFLKDKRILAASVCVIIGGCTLFT
jgi:hypothetical protein